MIKHGKALLTIAIIGTAISVYLTIEHYAPQVLWCPSITSVISCATDLSSSYAAIFGIPTSALALVWFAGVAAFARSSSKNARLGWSLIGIGGFTYSISAMGVLGKLCIWCTGLDVLILLTITLFLTQ